MEAELKSTRRKLNNALEPIKVMMVHQKHKLLHDEWLVFVERTRFSVLNHPDEYFGTDLTTVPDLSMLVTKIFDDFLSENKGA
ncbi:hypothetical protein [Chryseolinea lacunae]|uniref:Uncharacterized protein n=1 Tax=Chryseolinea lacunae TaxID=2801331 RepID=A0ABS1KVV6_9BACT|nr:hypothetical protein [Chryseolinea lacunae]MBL0743580.1 hypothetical protein [Chryseolinea lacunae]